MNYNKNNFISNLFMDIFDRLTKIPNHVKFTYN